MSVGDLWLGLARVAFFADRKTPPRQRQRQRGGPWRERPRDLTVSAIMPAATAEVAHATLEGCHRARRRVETAPHDGQILLAFRRHTGAVLGAPSTLVFRSNCETADAARGAATKSGGWRSSGTLSCQSKPTADEPASAKPDVASLSTPTTCKLRRRATSAAFCAAHEHT